MLTITIHNVETGEVIERPMNEEELAQAAKDKEIAEIEFIKKAEKVAAKNALLEKLGITQEEAKLLLG